MTNEEISLKTKRKLSEALKREMHRKLFSKITITDIIRDCNLNRNTFYYHFKDINELLKWSVEQDAINVLKDIDLITDSEEAIRFVLNYIEKNKYMINCAYDSAGLEHLKRFLYTDLKSIIDSNLRELDKMNSIPMDGNEMELLSMFFTEGIAGLIIHYVTDQKNLSREEIIKVTGRLFARFRIFLSE